MRVVIAGGHGQIALRLTRLLAEHGDEAVGLVRNPEHREDVEAVGGRCVVLDLEQADVSDVAEAIRDADAAVFAAGAGPGSGAARKDTVDRAAAVLFADAAEAAGVRRFVQVSSIGVDRADDPGQEPVFAAYLRAKAAAEEDLCKRDLDWTIVRPGRLTNDPATGRVHLVEQVGYGAVPRDDVAHVLAELCRQGTGVHRTLELVSGDTPIREAVSGLR